MNFLVVEDHSVVAHALIQLLSQHWQLAKVVHSRTLADAVTKVATETFDLIMLDLSLPDANGTEAVIKLSKIAKTPVLVMSFHEEAAYARRVMMLGAFGYLSKNAMPSVIIQAITHVLAGRKYIGSWLAEDMVNNLMDGSTSEPLHESLSKQEYRILIKIGGGKTTGEIARSMDLSAKTVGTYRARILFKLKLKDTTSLVKYCLEHHLIL
jgi:two-component system invasion response regulator UvrY